MPLAINRFFSYSLTKCRVSLGLNYGKTALRLAGCGGLIRDQNGKWILGFAKYLGNTSPYIAELWGVLQGLTLAKARNCGKVQLQVDSYVVVQSVLSRGRGNARGWSLIQEIRN